MESSSSGPTVAPPITSLAGLTMLTTEQGSADVCGVDGTDGLGGVCA